MPCDHENSVQGQQDGTNKDQSTVLAEKCQVLDESVNTSNESTVLDVQESDKNVQIESGSEDNDVPMTDCQMSISESDLSSRKHGILNRVASSSAHFVSQQLGEPDLTFLQKKEIALNILDKKPELFLYRFGKFMMKEDLEYFNQYKDNNYEVNYYMTQLEKTLDETKNKVKIKNRRYEALQRLMKRGEYFSDSEMKKRNPLMFEQMIGKYMTEEEKEKLDQIDYADLRLTTILMDHIERDQTSSLRRKQQQEEDALFQESEDDDEDEDDDDDLIVNGQFDFNKWKQKQGALPVDQPITDEERQMLRDEFVHSMHQNFLLGKDEEFDYCTVDDNEDYDPWDPYQDEENYFDSEEPQNAESEDFASTAAEECNFVK